MNDFDPQIKALDAKGIRPFVLVISEDLPAGRKFAERHLLYVSGNVSIVKPERTLEIRGVPFAGVVYLEPSEARVPSFPELPNVLATAAHLTDVHWTELVRVVRAGVVKAERLFDPTQWWCRECACKRPEQLCWKCGSSDSYHPVAGLEDPALPDIKLIRRLGHEMGYAIAEHGSRERDFDIVAIPWTEQAQPPEKLVDHLVKGLANDNGPAHLYKGETRPHGRTTVNIQVNGFYKLIDLSFMPRRFDLSPELIDAAWAHLGGHQQFMKTFGYQQFAEALRKLKED